MIDLLVTCDFCLQTNEEVGLILASVKKEGCYICYQCAIAAMTAARKYYAGEIEYKSWMPA